MPRRGGSTDDLALSRRLCGRANYVRPDLGSLRPQANDSRCFLRLLCGLAAVPVSRPISKRWWLGAFVQALGVSGSSVVARAVVRDLYEGAHASLQFSTMNMIMGIMPIFAPLMGGVLATFFGWHSVFIFQFARRCSDLVTGGVMSGGIAPRRHDFAVAKSCAAIATIATNKCFPRQHGNRRAGLFRPVCLDRRLAVHHADDRRAFAARLFDLLCGVVRRASSSAAGSARGWSSVMASTPWLASARRSARSRGLCVLAGAAFGVALPVTLTLSMGIYFVGHGDLAGAIHRSGADAVSEAGRHGVVIARLCAAMRAASSWARWSAHARQILGSADGAVDRRQLACGTLLLWASDAAGRAVPA